MLFSLLPVKVQIVSQVVILGIILSSSVVAEQTQTTTWTADQWLYNPLKWSFNGETFHTPEHEPGFAVLQAVPVSQRILMEADVEIVRAVAPSWCIAGVAVVADEANFWHFALVQSPEGRHFLELRQMRNGVWGDETNCQLVVNQNSPEAWQPGKRYRLRICLDSEGIEGVCTDREGRKLQQIRYAFSGVATRSGRPALHCRGFEASFAKLTINHSHPADLSLSPPVVAYQSDSFIPEITGEKTGFFHVQLLNNIWWVIDPVGRGFVPLGVDHVSYHGHGCEKLGYAPYERKNQAKYNNNVELWRKETIDRLHAWGFNLLGAGCSADLFHRGLAHTVFVPFGRSMAGMGDAMNILPDDGVPCSGFPNVFHPQFEAYCRYYAHQSCTGHVNDPWLFGYFLDNELAWWGKTGDIDAGLFDAVMQKSPDHTAKRALRDFLAQRYKNDIARFNRIWGVQLNSFDAILQLTSLGGTHSAAIMADKKAFVGLVADRYFGVITRAIRAVDPNHMILGSRFAGGYASEAVWAAAGRHCDIVTLNYYGSVDLQSGLARDDTDARHGKPLVDVFEKFYRTCQRPIMVTEWSFPALDAGLPSLHGAGQRFRTQAERAKATEITARTMLSLPFLVGYNYFMWVDEPALGISAKFPEDSNYGLVNEDGKPYELLTAAFTRVHRDAGRLRREGLQSAGVVSKAPSDIVSPIDQFLKRLRNQVADNPVAHQKLRFERRGDQYVATSGIWEINGNINNGLTAQIRHRGLVMGRFNGMLHQRFEAQNYWNAIDRLVDVQAKIDRAALKLDLVGRYQAPPQSKQRSFEIAYRLTLLPECDWFIVQFLRCHNVDNQPLDLHGIYFRLDSQIDGSAADDLPANVDRPPRLWGDVQGDAWIDSRASAFWGLVASDSDPVKIYFWLDDQKIQHPDAMLLVERRLRPNETYRPARPVAVLCLAGRGDLRQWQIQAREILDSLPKDQPSDRSGR